MKKLFVLFIGGHPKNFSPFKAMASEKPVKAIYRKEYSRFHKAFVAAFNDAQITQETYWMLNGKKQSVGRLKQETGDPGEPRFVPKNALVWGDYKDQTNPYIVAIPITSVREGVEKIKKGLESPSAAVDEAKAAPHGRFHGSGKKTELKEFWMFSGRLYESHEEAAEKAAKCFSTPKKVMKRVEIP